VGREVLGKDNAGRVVISTDDGFALLHRSALTELARLSLPPTAYAPMPFLDAHQTKVMIDDARPRQLIVARW